MVEIKSILTLCVAFIAPLLYFTGSNIGLLNGSPPRTPDLADATETGGQLTRLQNYLRIRTDHGDPDYAGATAYLNETVRALLPNAQIAQHSFVRGKPVLIVRIPGTNASLPSLLLNSHTDVVPAEASKWTHDPFSGTLARATSSSGDEQRVYGRGAQDMKSIGLSYLEAIANLQTSGWKPRRSIYVTYVPDEEIGGVDGMDALTQSPVFADMNVGVALDEGVPTPDEDIRIFYGERQKWSLIIKVKRIPGHGATLPADTAADVLSGIQTRLHAFRDKQRALLDAGSDIGEVVNVNVMFLKSGTVDNDLPGGYVMNVIPSQAELGVDMRVPPTIAKETMEAEVEAWMTCNGSRCPGTTLEWVLQSHIPIVTSRDAAKNAYILPFEAGLRAAGIADKLQHGIFFGATDARYLRRAGVPCFNISPINFTPNLLHMHDEYISVQTYKQCIRIHESLIKTLADFEAVEPDKEDL